MCDECCTGDETTIESTEGEKGDTPIISAGTTTTLDAGENATLTITGTPAAPILNFGIPEGLQGPAGRSYLGTLNATASAVLTEDQSGSLVMLNSVDAVQITLPANPAVGSYFRFQCAQATVAGYSILCPSGHKYLGYNYAKKSATADVIFSPNGTTNNLLSMNATTTGGLVGTDLLIVYLGSGRYTVSGCTFGSGALATSYSG